ncbi:hypothetical protein UlMin_002537 [Ulmus minor]
MRRAAQDDPYLQQVSRQSTTAPTGPYSVQNGLYFYKQRVIVPQALRNQLLQEFHDSKMARHSGVLRTFKRLAQQFYWPSMYRSVQDYITHCEVCQRTKTETLAPAGLLQPLPIPCHVWDDISLDFIEGLPSSHDKDSLLVVVDRLSEYAHFIALSHPFSAKIVAATFVEHIIKLHGMLKSIISDRDPIFISNFWQEFFTMSGTKLKLSSAYHPQTDGQTEVVNRCVEQYLRCFVHQWPRKCSVVGNDEGDGEIVVDDESFGELGEWDEMTHSWCWNNHDAYLRKYPLMFSLLSTLPPHRIFSSISTHSTLKIHYKNALNPNQNTNTNPNPNPNTEKSKFKSRSKSKSQSNSNIENIPKSKFIGEDRVEHINAGCVYIYISLWPGGGCRQDGLGTTAVLEPKNGVDQSSPRVTESVRARMLLEMIRKSWRGLQRLCTFRYL